MTSPTNGRNKWNRFNGTWTISLGSRGTRVRLFERAKGGVYYRDVWINGRKDRRSLQTSDRHEAERLGKLLLSELLSGRLETSGPLTLGTLWNRFSDECSIWLDNSATSRKGDEWSSKVLLGYFGENRNVSTLTENDQVAFQNARLQGGILLADGTTTEAVRARTVQSDLVLLKAMIRWATRTRVANGTPLLMFNPLDGVQLIREQNERRPIASWERFTKTRKAISQLVKEAATDEAKSRWYRIDLALVLAEGAGRRLGSIRQLHWDDINFSQSEIRWRAETDKKGKEWTIPIPPELLAELKAARKKLKAISGLVFAASKDPTKPMDRHLFDHWLAKAEERAKLPKLAGGLWHPYRRKWATERKHLPIKDVMAAGGWTDSDTLINSYQQADRATLLRVMNEPRKLSDTRKRA